MSVYLLDVNVLIALAWPVHMHHRQAQEWFAEKGQSAFATCPLTQTAFVRISSNPAFTAAAVSPREAVGLLERIAALPGHRFWPDDLPVPEAIDPGLLLAGHRQITDAYLLGLARRHNGKLATLDRAVAALAGVHSGDVELLQP